MTEIDYFRRAGELLYGPRWQREMARSLDVHERTVRRWLDDGRVSERVLRNVEQTLWERRVRIGLLIETRID